MEAKSANDFTQGDIQQAILRMAVPLMMAYLVNVLYSVVDRIYIGHIAEIGKTALTGMGVAVPITTIIASFAALCCAGGAPLCSIARGRGDLEEAEALMAHSFVLLLITAFLITVFVEAFMTPLLNAFGASPETFPYASVYGRIYVAGTLFVMLSLGMNYFINSQGFAKIGMLTVTLGAVLNIVLDPLFIFVFRLGIAGAAYATVLSQMASAVWVMRFILGPKSILKLRRRGMKLNLKRCGRILGLGLTGFVAKATNGAVMICCNTQLQQFGGDLYVGAMTVMNSIRDMAFMAVHGLSEGSQPVLGYNYGAGAYERVKKGIRFLTGINLAYTLAAGALIMCIPGTLIKAFNDDAALLAVAKPCMRIFLCGLPLMGFQACGQSIFVGLGKTKRAVFFSCLRKVIIVIPLVYLLPPLMGVNGVFWSEPISDLLGGLACYTTMYLTLYRKL